MKNPEDIIIDALIKQGYSEMDVIYMVAQVIDDGIDCYKELLGIK